MYYVFTIWFPQLSTKDGGNDIALLFQVATVTRSLISTMFSTRNSCIPGEIKRSKLKRGSDITESNLHNDLSMPVEYLKEKTALCPFFQCFINIMDSETGNGILSNYYKSRYFRLNLRDESIYMSPVVKIDQV